MSNADRALDFFEYLSACTPRLCFILGDCVIFETHATMESVDFSLSEFLA